MPVQLIKPRRFGDERGWFSETYRDATYRALGLNVDFCQDNHSYSRSPFVLRGLHFQRPPHAQAKLVRCVRGAIWDVAVDIRRASPTYGQSVAAEISAKNGLQIYIPVGFAHGLLTLEADTEVEYKVSDYYAPDCDAGLMWNDTTLSLPWPLAGQQPSLSDKDQTHGSLADFESPFAYDGNPLVQLAVPG